jgi:hypothetical protein
MKKANSPLIRAILAHVEAGRLEGKEGPAKDDLQKMVEALTAIESGMEPDEALGIKRTAGRRPDETWDFICLFVHNLRPKEKWAVIKLLVNDYLKRIGRGPVTESAIRKVYAKRKPELEKLRGPQGLHEHSAGVGEIEFPAAKMRIEGHAPTVLISK